MKPLIFFWIMLAIPFITGAQSVSEQARGNNQFAFKLFAQCSKQQNPVVSPYSVRMAMAMPYFGAVGKTQSQMSQALVFSEHAEELAAAITKFDATVVEKNTITLKSANSIWYQQDYKLQEDYLELMNKYYKTNNFEVDFKNTRKRQKALKDINNWVSDQTENKIKNLLTPLHLNKETRLVLVNALYFNGAWEKSFKKQLSSERYFFTTPDDSVKTVFMKQKESFEYYEDSFFQVLKMDFDNREASMLLFLPTSKDSSQAKWNRVDEAYFNKLQKSMRSTQINLQMPRFKVEHAVELSGALQSMGIVDAFNNDADFSGITGNKELRIDKVVHKTVLEVDEAGCEAAAATAVTMVRKTSIVGLNPVDFIANRPFLYLIQDNNTHAILFVGLLHKPTVAVE